MIDSNEVIDWAYDNMTLDAAPIVPAVARGMPSAQMAAKRLNDWRAEWWPRRKARSITSLYRHPLLMTWADEWNEERVP